MEKVINIKNLLNELDRRIARIETAQQQAKDEELSREAVSVYQGELYALRLFKEWVESK
jgi:hypothetical protein